MTAANTAKTVLIIDDDPSHLKIYGWIVERGGFRCILALVENGSLSFPEAEHIDVAVLDYRLGTITAVEVAQRLRRTYPVTPILILSDMFGMPDDVAPHVSGFIRKGEPQQLLDTLQSIFEKAKAEGSATSD